MSNLNLVPEVVTLTLQQCTFCHSRHADAKEAEAHGCTAGIPEKKFEVGDLVTAKFDIGAGMEVVGEGTFRARVSAIQQPSAAYSIGEPHRLGWYSSSHFGIASALRAHDWMVTLEPLEQPKGQKGVIFAQTVPQSDCRPVPKE